MLALILAAVVLAACAAGEEGAFSSSAPTAGGPAVSEGAEGSWRPEGSSAPEGASVSAEAEGAGAEVMEVRAWPVHGAGDCRALSRGRALLEATALGLTEMDAAGNLWAVDLAAGEQLSGKVSANLGLCCDDGTSLWWVEAVDQPVAGAPFSEPVQTGIRQGKDSWNSRWLYACDQRPGGEWRWRITELAQGEGRLVWKESWLFKDGGQGPSVHNRLWVMADDGTTDPVQLAAWDTWDVVYHQLRLHGRWLVWWEEIRNGETAIHVVDLSDNSEVLTAAAIGPRDADFDGERLVWCSPAAYEGSHTLWARGVDDEVPRAVDIPGAEGPEEIGRLGLIDGRVLYSLCTGEDSLCEVRLLDPDTGELLYCSEEDPRVVREGLRYNGPGLVFDPAGGTAAFCRRNRAGAGMLTVFRPVAQ